MPFGRWRTTFQHGTPIDLAYHFCIVIKLLECGPMPNVMAAQPNIGGAVCESSVIGNSIPCTMPQSLADAHCWSAVQ